MRVFVALSIELLCNDFIEKYNRFYTSTTFAGSFFIKGTIIGSF